MRLTNLLNTCKLLAWIPTPDPSPTNLVLIRQLCRNTLTGSRLVEFLFVLSQLTVAYCCATLKAEGDAMLTGALMNIEVC